MKITVVYHSESGNTAKMAECIVKGIQGVAIGGELEKYEELFEIYGKRFAEQTANIF